MKIKIDNIYDYLKPITFNDFDIIYSFFKKHPSENCGFNICNIFTWGLYYKLEYTICFDRLILFNPSYSYLFAPIGEAFSAEELFQINNSFKKIHSNLEILGVSEDYINNPNLSEYFHITNYENWSDYIYTTENLVKLTGKKLAKKKNLISQFNKLYTDYTVKLINANDYAEIIEFCYYWKKTHGVEDEYLDIEFEAIKTILTHWETFPCNGLKLYTDGKICAFSIYSPQTNNMATVHFEKYDSQIKGAGQVINQETAKVLIKDFKYINREEDMGSEGIRQAKRSYQPDKILPYYRLKSK
ncbi:MAG: phosphatidylglycerol lysyltransferase domain-containing protein [Spirochaetaceae bacterium]|nr:phosphatidylglycerol lysyltransferase domain-containing protein [Spirochaetaceae bacterium]